MKCIESFDGVSQPGLGKPPVAVLMPPLRPLQWSIRPYPRTPSSGPVVLFPMQSNTPVEFSSLLDRPERPFAVNALELSSAFIFLNQ